MLMARISALIALAIVPVGIWLYARGESRDAARVPSVRVDVPQQKPAHAVFEREFSIGSGGRLVVDLPDADVTVRAAAGSTVRIEAVVSARDLEGGREGFDRMGFRADVEGTTVRLRAEQSGTERQQWGDHHDVPLAAVVTVPRMFDVEVASADGDIVVEEVIGRVDLRTADGDISLGGVAGDELRVETADGDIVADRLDAGRTWLRTSDGDIRVHSVGGALEAHTSDGDIDVRLADVQGASLSTHDGDITVSVPEDLRADVILEGEDLSVPSGLSIRGQMSRRRIEGTMNGGGPRIEARTQDGQIWLKAVR